MPRFRASIVWLAAIFVLTGSAIGFATVGEQGKKPPKSESTKGPGTGDEKKADKASKAQNEPSNAGERKRNHGFFVSQAAHCEDVDDPETSESPDFTAPEDCTGSAHGKYVSEVAKSSLGKKPKN
jgi:hypothetical protein